MHRFFDRYPADAMAGRPVVALGVFDGVHRGHLAVLRTARKEALHLHAPSLVLTFDTHPRQVVHRNGPLAITSLEHRLVLFEQAGMEAALVLSFDERLRSLSAETFVRERLMDLLQAQGIVIGTEARFGRDRAGDWELLCVLGQQHGFFCRTVEPLLLDGKRISSTRIREAVTAGNLNLAAAMLGRPVSVLGTVVEGQGLARRLGFPTLNLDLHHELHPPRGVYLSRTRCGETVWNSITNVGHRPAAAALGPEDVLIESHLLDFHGDLYGQTAEVFFLEKIRDERRFASHNDLAAQVHLDLAEARRRLGS